MQYGASQNARQNPEAGYLKPSRNALHDKKPVDDSIAL